MIPAGCEAGILRRLAEMPFLDRLELAPPSPAGPGARSTPGWTGCSNGGWLTPSPTLRNS